MQQLNENPWFSMWLSPRKTIRYIVEKNPKMGFYFLSSIWFLQLFFLSYSYAEIRLPFHPLIPVIIAVILSPIIGGVSFYFFSWILSFTGRWLKGKASHMNLQSAFAWSRIPCIIDFIMWVILFASVIELIFVQKISLPSLFFISFISSITSIWSFVLLVITVQELQQFSLTKALVNVILTYIIILAILMFVSAIYYKIILA